MKVKTAYSQKTETGAIISDIKNQLADFDAKFILYFSSSTIEPAAISAQMQKAFSKSETIGCTTSGEIITGKMLDNSLVAMAFTGEIASDLRIEVLTNISTDEKAVDKAFDSFSDYYKQPMASMNTHDYVGLVLIDGLSKKEEKIIERIGDLTNVSFIGGSAGDDLKFSETFVFANGICYKNAAVLALLKCESAFEIIKTQSFKAKPVKLNITKADEENRTVFEINNKPAAGEYARLVGKAPEHVSDAFFTNPLGIGLGNEIFVRSPQKTVGNSIVFYCSIKEGMELSLLEATDIISDTKNAIEEKLHSLGTISAIINFNCILRTIELKAENKQIAYGNLFENIPTVGFSTYGECYLGHINQTATMLVFK